MLVLLLLALCVSCGGAHKEVATESPPAPLIEPRFPVDGVPCYWTWGGHLFRVTFERDGTYTAAEGSDRWSGRWRRTGNTIHFDEWYVGPGGERGPRRAFDFDLAPGRWCVPGSVRGAYTLRHVKFYGYE